MGARAHTHSRTDLTTIKTNYGFLFAPSARFRNTKEKSSTPKKFRSTTAPTRCPYMCATFNIHQRAGLEASRCRWRLFPRCCTTLATLRCYRSMWFPYTGGRSYWLQTCRGSFFFSFCVHHSAHWIYLWWIYMHVLTSSLICMGWTRGANATRKNCS